MITKDINTHRKEEHIVSIDCLKGILILLVIIGHIALGTVEKNLLRYTVYSFHMPLFMAISGYLLNLEKLQKMNLAELVNKYIFRLIIPWIIAVCVYYFIRHHHYSVSALLKEFVYTFYHLWFVPAFLFFVFICWLFLKTKLPVWYLLILAVFVHIMLIILRFKVQLTPESLRVIRQLLFFFYFSLALCLKYYAVNIKTSYLSIILCISVVFNFYFFYHHIAVFSDINTLILNSSLAILLLTNLKNIAIPFTSFFSWFGVNSLAVYLWHIFPKLISIEILTKFNKFGGGIIIY
jgi:fucose 4-O-acetylase-like acetyltransferase